jgi:pheromone shutdown protein TraB
MQMMDEAEPRLHDTVLIHARDEHMAQRIAQLARKGIKAGNSCGSSSRGTDSSYDEQSADYSPDSGAQEQPLRRIVAVVGRAHVPGIRAILESMQSKPAAQAKQRRRKAVVAVAV